MDRPPSTRSACYRVTYFGCGVYLANTTGPRRVTTHSTYILREIRYLYVHPSFDLTCVGALALLNVSKAAHAPTLSKDSLLARQVGRCVPRCVPLLRSAESGVEDDPHRVWRVVREPDEHLLRTLHHLAHLHSYGWATHECALCFAAQPRFCSVVQPSCSTLWTSR